MASKFPEIDMFKAALFERDNRISELSAENVRLHAALDAVWFTYECYWCGARVDWTHEDGLVIHEPGCKFAIALGLAMMP